MCNSSAVCRYFCPCSWVELTEAITIMKGTWTGIGQSLCLSTWSARLRCYPLSWTWCQVTLRGRPFFHFLWKLPVSISTISLPSMYTIHINFLQISFLNFCYLPSINRFFSGSYQDFEHFMTAFFVHFANQIHGVKGLSFPKFWIMKYSTLRNLG